MANFPHRSFAAGELSPSHYARVDLARYHSGAKTILNGYVMRSGGIQSRPGTSYLGTLEGVSRLIPWRFDADQSVLLEFSDESLRFWVNDVLVTPGASWTTWDSGTTYGEGDYALSSSIWYRALRTTVNDTPASSPSDWVADASYRVVTPYGDDELDGIQFLQDASGMRLVHPSYHPQLLTRTADDDWTLADVFFGFTLDAPANPTNDDVGTGGPAYVVTAASSIYAAESLPSASTQCDTAILSLPGSPVEVSWDAVADATHYNVYRTPNPGAASPVYFFQGTVAAPTVAFTDDEIPPADNTVFPPTSTGRFAAAGEYPGVIGAYQQRVLYSGSTSEPAATYTSRSAEPDAFDPVDATALVASDPVSWTQIAKRLNRTRHYLDLEKLIALTSEGEWVVEGDDAGILAGDSPPNLRKFSENGSASYPPPLVVDRSALYTQARGSVVRDLLGVEGGTFAGTDLTVPSQHLFDGYTLTDWDYQRIPHSVIWASRSDGVLLTLTYQRESGVFAWTRHSTIGTVERVCVLPDGNEDAVYLVVLRTINSTPVRYLERMANRSADYADQVCVDAALTFAFARPFATLTLTATATIVGPPDTYTYTAVGGGGTGQFYAHDVGREVTLVLGGNTVTFTINALNSATSVALHTQDANGVGFDAEVVATGNWAYVVTGTAAISGLDHLEGQQVSVFADGAPVASPYNAAYGSALTVTSGSITLAAPVEAVTVGLPFVMDVETLDLDSASPSKKDAGILVTHVGLWLEDSRTPFAAAEYPSGATSVTGMQQMVAVDEDENTTAALITGYRDVRIDGAWTRHGRIALRHVDPVPLSILAVIPHGTFGRS